MSRSKAAKAYEDFHGEPPRYIDKTRLDEGAVQAYDLGKVEAIAYEAKRDGETSKYMHKFRKSSRPTLAVRHDGKQLYLADGKYHVTDRGIEDMATELFRVNPIKGKRKLSPMARTVKRRRRRPTSRAVSVYRPNPVRRPRRRRRSSVATYRRNPIRRNPARSRKRHLRRYKRNPIGLTRGKGNLHIMPMIIPAIMVGAGAVGAELILGYAPIPANMKTGMLRHAVKALVGVGLGMAVAKFFNKRAGEALAVGAITISSHDAIKDTLIQFSPATLQFDGMNEYVPGLNEYVPGMAGLGFQNPAPTMGQVVPTSWDEPNYVD